MFETRTNHACLPCRDTAGTGLWLQNNAWGFDGDDPPQRVCAAPEGLAWDWRWPARGGADDARVVAFPGAICGRKPFGGLPTSTPALPVPAADAARGLRATHDLRLSASGAYNAAFDLWLIDRPDAGEDGILAEVMVWLAHRRLHPAGTWRETPATPHGPARFHDGAVRHWRCLTFVLEQPRLAGTTDLGFFLRWLLATQRLPETAWLASVELGTEICHGRGRAELRGFRVDLPTAAPP